ncbi:MAG: threonylcarbamoyl-AMP synthase [Gammaproteobacteria bacterium]|nr:threonylcarbamoyl-AMP synthase [Gammaproteobacteria bacterium]MCF6231072.1 threonylcarbamoyl-AMP synthase [Gammaproteobacteria bacterium]
MSYLERERLQQAARIIHQGGVIAYPTEAVYGLGCDPQNGEAVAKILRMKRRSAAKGVILIASSIEQLAPYVLFADLDEEALLNINNSWPGPSTWLIRAKPKTPKWLRGQHQTLAVRVTNHPIAKGLCEAVQGAIVSTSANLSNRPPATTAKECRFIFRQQLDHIVKGSVEPNAKPSTIRDAASGTLIRA